MEITPKKRIDLQRYIIIKLINIIPKVMLAAIPKAALSAAKGAAKSSEGKCVVLHMIWVLHLRAMK